MSDSNTDSNAAQCVQCGHTQEEADSEVTFHELDDGAHWCSACRSVMDGWKEEHEFLVLFNDRCDDEDSQ